VLRFILAGATVLMAACDSPKTPTGACRPVPPPEAADKAAIAKVTDTALQNAMAGKPVMPAGERTAARREVVLACLHRSGYRAAQSGSEAQAVDAALGSCAEVIDRFVKFDAVEAALSGDPIPDPGALAELRSSFRATAIERVREAKAGRCWRKLT